MIPNGTLVIANGDRGKTHPLCGPLVFVIVGGGSAGGKMWATTRTRLLWLIGFFRRSRRRDADDITADAFGGTSGSFGVVVRL